MIIFNPLDHPICLATPLRLAQSAWIQHIPFGMFLVDILRPKIIVELGAYTGVSYCAFCQAVKTLRIETRCYAIDTWEGDPHAGFYGPELLQELKEHHDPLYASFSRLEQSTFDGALEHFAAGSIDLLHIDGFHSYDAAKGDFEKWLPKMSRWGVVMFHDINVRERQFGLWKLWEELKAKYPHFAFFHGHGLGILGVGSQQLESMQAFYGASEPEAAVIREFFHLLGSNIEKAAEEKRVSEMLERIRVLTAEAAEAKQYAAEAKLYVEKVQKLWAIRFSQVWSNKRFAGFVKEGLAKARERILPPPRKD